MLSGHINLLKKTPPNSDFTMNVSNATYNGAKLRVRNFVRNTNFGRMIVNAGWLGSAMPLTMAAGVLKTVLLARLLGVEGLGTYGLVMAFTSMLALVFGFTSVEAAITFTNRAVGANNRPAAAQIIRYCLFFDLLLSVFAYIVLVLASRFFAGWFHIDSTARVVLLVYGLSIIGSATHRISVGLLHLCDCFKYDFFLNVGKSWISLGCIGVVYFLRGNLLAVAFVQTIVSGIFGGAFLFFAFRVLHAQGLHFSLSKTRWWRVPKEVWRYQFFGYLKTTVKGLHRHMGVLLLGYLCVPAEVGIFYAAKRLTDPLRNSAQIFVQSLYPRYGMLWFSSQTHELQVLFKRSSVLFIILGSLMLMLFWPFMGRIAKAVYGMGFSSAVDPALAFLSVASLLLITAPLNALLPAIGKNLAPLVAATVMIISQTCFLVLFVPCYGATGAAWSFFLTVLVGNVVLLPQTIAVLRKRLFK